jgi:predicted PurR-regulated permease PerM
LFLLGTLTLIVLFYPGKLLITGEKENLTMSKLKKYLIPQDASILFYAFFILFVLICLAASGSYYRFAKDTFMKQQRALDKLQKQVNWNTETNKNQNFSITENEKEINILRRKIK